MDNTKKNIIFKDTGQGLRRCSSRDDLENPSKRRRLNDTDWSKETITLNSISTNQRSRTFANDRLKRLRDQISKEEPKKSCEPTAKKSPRSLQLHSQTTKSIPPKVTENTDKFSNINSQYQRNSDCALHIEKHNDINHRLRVSLSESNHTNTQLFNKTKYENFSPLSREKTCQISNNVTEKVCSLKPIAALNVEESTRYSMKMYLNPASAIINTKALSSCKNTSFSNKIDSPENKAVQVPSSSSWSQINANNRYESQIVNGENLLKIKHETPKKYSSNSVYSPTNYNRTVEHTDHYVKLENCLGNSHGYSRNSMQQCATETTQRTPHSDSIKHKYSNLGKRTPPSVQKRLKISSKSESASPSLRLPPERTISIRDGLEQVHSRESISKIVNSPASINQNNNWTDKYERTISIKDGLDQVHSRESTTKIVNSPASTSRNNNLTVNSRESISKIVNSPASTSHNNNNWTDKYESSTNSINYGQILNAIYNKYFCDTATSADINYKEAKSKDLGDSMDWEEECSKSKNDEASSSFSCESSPSKNEKREFYITVDTNVFLKDLVVLREIVKNGAVGGIKPIIYVPWMVLSELDFMKDDRNTPGRLKVRVRKAVDFINVTLVEGNRKLIGQNLLDADEQSYVGKSPDDKIISCCLQAKEKYNKVIMLSNDVNLKNRLLVNGIIALSTKELLSNFNDSYIKENLNNTNSERTSKISKVSDIMSSCCTIIICDCAEEAYGNVWTKMAMLGNPPWTLGHCLKIFKKYWGTVFRDKLMKQSLKAVEQLEILEKELDRSTNKNEEFIQCCLTLLIYFKDLEQHKSLVAKTLREIHEV